MLNKKILLSVLCTVYFLNMFGILFLLLTNRNPKYIVNTINEDSTSITVCKTGCAFDDFNKAIASAKNNNTILIKGNYDGNGVISRKSDWELKLSAEVKTLNIVGENTVWSLSKNNLDGSQLKIEDISGTTINFKTLTFDSNNETNSSINIASSNNATFTFSEVKVNNSKAAGLYIDGASKVSIDHSSFSSNFWPGVSAHGNSKVSISKSKFENHIHNGVDAKDTANVEISNSEFLKNNSKWDEKDKEDNYFASGAVQFYNNSTGKVIGSLFDGNIGTAIKTGRDRQGTINEAPKVEISGNTVKNSVNEVGIYITQNSDVIIKNNIIVNNKLDGIAVQNTSKALIENNTIDLNGKTGILCLANADCTIKNNIITNSKQGGGIGGWDFNGKILVQNNDVWNNKYALESTDPNYVVGGNSSTKISKGQGDISVDPKYSSDYKTSEPSVSTMGAYAGTGACNVTNSCSTPNPTVGCGYPSKTSFADLSNNNKVEIRDFLCFKNEFLAKRNLNEQKLPPKSACTYPSDFSTIDYNKDLDVSIDDFVCFKDEYVRNIHL